MRVPCCNMSIRLPSCFLHLMPEWPAVAVGRGTSGGLPAVLRCARLCQFN